MTATTEDRTSMTAITTEAAKHARWAVQRHTSHLSITPVRVGLVEMGLNALRRRPAEFPTFRFATLRREIVKRAARHPLTHADIAVAKLRLDLLGSPIDSRHSAPVDGAAVDLFADDAIIDAENRHGVIFDEPMRQSVQDAVWAQFGEFYGANAKSRVSFMNVSSGMLPFSGAELRRTLRDIEGAHVRAVKAHPRRR